MWTIVGTAVMQACAMAASILAARVLGRATFGEFGILRSTITTFGVLAGSSVGITATKLVAEFRTVDRVRAGRIISTLINLALMVSGAVTLFCMVVAGPLAKSVLRAPHLVTGLRMLAVLLLLSTVGGVQIAILAGLEEFRSIAILSGVEGILSASAVTAGAHVFGLNGALAGTVAAPAVMFFFKQRAVTVMCTKAGIEIARGSVMEHLPIMWSHVLPALLMGVSAQPFEWFGRVLLARRPGGFSDVGVFTAAYTLAQIVSFATAQISSPAIPVLANTYKEGDRKAFIDLLRLLSLAMAGVTVAVVMPLVVFAPWIMRIYGHGFADGGPVLATIVIASGISSASALFRVVLVATGRLWSQNLHSAIGGLVMIGSFVALLRFGALGLAIAYVVGYSVVMFTQGFSVFQAVRAPAGAH
jgi:O-antigen/teichoic acid export membrane protein